MVKKHMPQTGQNFAEGLRSSEIMRPTTRSPFCIRFLKEKILGSLSVFSLEARNKSLSIERHGVAQVLIGVRNPAADEADEAGAFGQFLDFVDFFQTGKHAQVAGMLAPANLFRHALLPAKSFSSLPRPAFLRKTYIITNLDVLVKSSRCKARKN